MGTQQQTPKPMDPDWIAKARRSGVLSRLPDRLIEPFMHGGRRVTYPTGAVISWDIAPDAALVLSGSLRVFIASPDGAQVTLRYLRPGHIVGTFNALDPSLARTVQALETAEVLHVDVPQMTDLAQREPAVSWALFLEMNATMRETHRAFCMRAFGSVRTRVANVIVERALASGGLRHMAAIKGTQHDLADAAGSVREVVATALQGLKRDGVIAIRRGAVVILDPARLSEEARGNLGSPVA